jgi:hypothetical protein
MSETQTETVTEVVVEEAVVQERRARFRDAVGGLSTRASSGDLLKQILLPAAFLCTGGIVLMLMGWWGAARTHREIEQIPYLISGGLLGLALTVLGGLLLATAVWMSSMAKMRRESDERLAAAIAAARAQVIEIPVPVPAAPVRRVTKPRNGSKAAAAKATEA